MRILFPYSKRFSVGIFKFIKFLSADLFTIKVNRCGKVVYPSFCGLQAQSAFSTTSINEMAIHTTKGWKINARSGAKTLDKIHSDETSVSCEEGSGAIQHDYLISQLEMCSSVANQIETFCSLMSITAEEIESRKMFCEDLVEILKIYFPHFKIHQFGSSINGLGFRGCDVDVSLQTIFDNKDYITLKQVPTLDSVLQGSEDPETIAHMHPRSLLRFVRRIFRRHCSDIKEPILLIKARCPILRFYNAKYDVFCDFSCENKFSLCNTKLLRLICHLDERFAPLVKLVRYWGKHGGFVGDIDMLNSYAFSLLIIYFLQNTRVPVLPPLSEVISKSDYLKIGDVADSELLFQDLKHFQPPKNTQTVEELLREFFFYYLSFDFTRVLLPFSNSSVPKSSFVPANDLADIFEFGTITVQDPFRFSNATASASFKSCKRFLHNTIEACKVYQNDFAWIPETEMWGICSLFHPPISESDMLKEWQQNLAHKIILPLKPNASPKLKSILEYGLLFECTQLIILNDCNPKPFLRMNCKAYHNTWQGRDWALKKYSEATYDPLELEHKISVELSQSKMENRRQLLCEFLSEYYEIEGEIKMMLTFKESKFPPIVAVFLKEFVPFIYEKL